MESTYNHKKLTPIQLRQRQIVQLYFQNPSWVESLEVTKLNILIKLESVSLSSLISWTDSIQWEIKRYY